MSLGQMNVRDRRALIGGATVLVAAWVILRLVPAIAHWHSDAREDARRARNRLAIAHQVIAQRTRTRRAIEALRGRSTGLDSLFISGPPALAGAALSAILSDYAAASGVQVSAVQFETGTQANSTSPSDRVKARVSITGSMQMFSDFLAMVEEAPPLLAVRELTIAQPDLQLSDTRTESIHAELLIEGMIRPSPVSRSGGR